ncbi:hypothetical protein EFK50_15030 [Nocardioides marmoriginsengisoli]|uniref:Beta-mannosidase-like galactose-binding domain-containing protein n=1 Tax=Nocardioides marmoriginsengisoli TaxID=661483 RepID=A0A3N0CJ35_9ACTN|nr:glycosyl hydrolase [Nocardioides marmoriginsengisoli]RNL63026.1 hypothetical protein EFK50_15030 [Nocardioides marmoriginsengisoli]
MDRVKHLPAKLAATAIAAALIVGTLMQPVSADTAADPLGLRPWLAEPGQNHRPGAFWWWPGSDVTPAGLDADIKALRDSGFGSAQIIDLEPGPPTNGTPSWQWGTKPWYAAVNAALRSGIKHGVRLDTAPYPVWPMASPTATLDNGLSAQAAHIAQLPLIGGVPYVGPVPDPLEKVGHKTLESVSAARVVGLGKKGSVELDPASAIDLTGRVRNKLLTWTPPRGNWMLFGVWRRPTGQVPQTVPGGAVMSLDANLSALFGKNLLVIDPFSKRATGAALRWLDQNMMSPAQEALWRRNGGQFYEDSFEYAVNLTDAVLVELIKDLAENGLSLPNRSLDVTSLHRLGAHWSAELIDQFANRRGYSIRPFLPALFNGPAGFDFTGGVGERVRNDYRRTLTDLIIAHQRQLRRWALDHGFTEMRHQSYGLPIDSTRAQGASGGIPDSETLEAGYPQPAGSAGSEGALDMYRTAAGAAHVYGSKEVNLEAGDVFGLPDCSHLGDPKNRRFCLYGQQPTDYWQIFNHGFAGGATHLQLHGLAYQQPQAGLKAAGWLGPQLHPWPGWSPMWYFFSESWNRNWPQFKYWREFNTYLGRASKVLTVGKPRLDVAVFRDDTVPFGIPVLPGHTRRQNLVRAGYTYEFVDPVTLAERGTVRGKRLYPDGPGYRALVIDPSDIAPTGFSGEAAVRILALARRGLPVVVVGALPSTGTSAMAARIEDTQVRQSFARLVRLGNVARARTSADVLGALGRLGVRPDAAFGAPRLVRPVHRATATRDYWYFWNEDTRRVRFDATLRTRGTPYELDLWNNRTTPIGEYRTGRGGLVVPVDLGPQEAITIVVDRSRPARPHVLRTTADRAVLDRGRLVLEDDRGGVQRAVLAGGKKVRVALPAAKAPRTLSRWNLTVREFTPREPRTHRMVLDGLRDWRKIPALANVAGDATYTTTFRLPAGWRSRSHGVDLQLGEVYGAARVWLNGRRVTQSTVHLAGARYRISGLLRRGTNTLRIDLATPPRNAMVGQVRSGDPRYGYFAMSPPQANGVVGPVRLLAVPRARLPR